MSNTGTMNEEREASEPTIRLASVDDALRIAEIYGYYVETSAATFEYVAPSAEEMRRRIAATLNRYPYVVAERNGVVIGFAYAGPLRSRSAYDWSCEMTIYVASDERGSGVGKMLYGELEELLRRMGMLSAYACVAYADPEDEFLSNASFRFHERMGYMMVGKFDDCGNKFGRWYDITWMKKDLNPHLPDPQPVVPFPCLDNA